MKHSFGALMLFTCLYAVTACNNNPQKPQVTDPTMPVVEHVDSAAIKTERNKATALASIDAFNSHNVDGVLKDAVTDLVDYGDGSGMVFKGRDSIKAMIAQYLKAFSDTKGENISVIAEGNKVAVFGTWSGKFTGEFMGMKPNGKSYKYDDVDIFTFNDAGQITSHRSTQNGKLMWMQLGVNMK
ncbi:ester cyclase [Pinibacter aurantiacus]|uniref:Ester cyclase n=1 Tax=Pinibacter aurantiacus TaxID=2851599 RepID=A0A9E2W2J7_9BACT|nr:ester cyclase [Pinibacter aurantiacus]MBV4357405.1 ester cyclase [Pinibacter aurantiacus]